MSAQSCSPQNVPLNSLSLNPPAPYLKGPKHITSTALLGPPKRLVLAPKCPGPGGPWWAPGGHIWSHLPPIDPTGIKSWLQYTLTCYWALPGHQKGHLLAQTALFGDPEGHWRARFVFNRRRLVRMGWTNGHHTHRIDIGPFCGGQGPNLVQKGAFWAKAGPFRPPRPRRDPIPGQSMW